jgi:porin-like protein
MKMVKGLLLGSAAGLVAVAGAQAADLPVKAKPVQYVKICSLYGVGFYYIPGTDMCLKMGGWVRAEYTYGANGNIAWGWANNNANDRTTNNSTWRARGYITADARNQTEYGTVRGYIAVGINSSDTGGGSSASFNANRAFIQWAGFTFGLAQSFFDFYSVPATSYWGQFPASDTGDGGWMVAGYTAQFGNGFSATLAAEMRRSTQITYETGGQGAGVGALTGYGGFQAPDVVANLRVDQAWGSAQIMGALHQVNATYYLGGRDAGHPDDALGFAVGGGLKLNAPMIGQGDYLQTQVTYSEGALRYVFNTPSTNWNKTDGNSAGFGVLSDAAFGGNIGNVTFPATDLQLTTGWNVNAAYEHFWNPRWRTSLYGGYAAVSFSDTANQLMCTGRLTLQVTNGCDQNWSTWWIGSRTQWNVTKDFYMGVDVLYSRLQSATLGSGLTTGNGATVFADRAIAAGGYGIKPMDDQDQLLVRFRVHRDFYP